MLFCPLNMNQESKQNLFPAVSIKYLTIMPILHSRRPLSLCLVDGKPQKTITDGKVNDAN